MGRIEGQKQEASLRFQVETSTRQIHPESTIIFTIINFTLHCRNMVKRLQTSPSLSPPPATETTKTAQGKKRKYEPNDEFQQVSKSDFVDQYRITGMGYGGDVYYKSNVS